MLTGPDKYNSMTALYDDPLNVEGTTYGKRWRRHEWSQTVEEQVTDNVETQKIVMAIHGGGIEPGTSEIALATAGYHPATLTPVVDGHGLHDFWLFEGLLSCGNGKLHVTASNYDEPIATELVQNARRCISLHGCSDTQAKVSDTQPNGIIQIGGLDHELRDIVLEELTVVEIPAEITTNPELEVVHQRTSPTRQKLVVAFNWRWGLAIVQACSGPTRGRSGRTQPTLSFGYWSGLCVRR